VIRSAGFQLWLLSFKARSVSKTKREKAVPVNLNAPCRENDHTQCRDGTARANESARSARAFCEVMLKVLNRDNQLRRMCVQRRWQGLQCDRSDTYDRDGTAQRIVGANIDVTERKKPELTLAERTLQLALAERTTMVGTLAYDVDAEKMQISEGYAAIHGFPDGTTETAQRMANRCAS
jgi:hypothetical protein